jgi:hypothetical protein
LLQRLADPAGVVPVWSWCELEPGHDGLHFLEVLQSREQVWWLGWRDGPHTRQLRPLPPCPAEDDPDARGDTAPCVLFLGHPGRHSFSYDVGDLPEPQRPPLLVPADSDVDVDLDDLTESQRHNRTRLRAEGLTVPTYLYLTQLLAQEEVMGERSTRHPFGTTDIPLPQVTRYPVATPGLAAAVARGYLIAHASPPYEPLYGGNRADSVVVELTPAGRAVCRRIDPDRFPPLRLTKSA